MKLFRIKRIKKIILLACWKDRTAETRFSTTLFKGTSKSGEAGQYVLAFKGSKEAKDFVVADIGDIVLDGFAPR